MGLVILFAITSSFIAASVEGFLIKPFWHWKLMSVISPTKYGDCKGYFNIMFFGIYTLGFAEGWRIGVPIFLDDEFKSHSKEAYSWVTRLVKQRTRIIAYLGVVFFVPIVVLILEFMT